MPSALVFGKPSISRVYCAKCDEETIHQYGACIHCQKAVTQKPSVSFPWNGASVRIKRR